MISIITDSYIKENPSQLNDPRWKGFVKNAEGINYMVDFVGLAKKQLLDAGVKKENIFESGIDTVKDKRFYSHVRDGSKDLKYQGRFACVVGIR